MNEVVLLTKDDCSLCEQAKATLRLLSDEHELAVREVPLDSDEGKRLALKTAAPFPPVVFLNGEPFSYGRLSARRLRRALR